MSKKIITKKLGEGLEEDRTDWARLDAMSDEDIDYSDIPELDESFWEKAAVTLPKNKERLTVRFDADVVAWFKKQGRGYQTKMNAVLRSFYEAHKNES